MVKECPIVIYKNYNEKGAVHFPGCWLLFTRITKLSRTKALTTQSLICVHFPVYTVILISKS